MSKVNAILGQLQDRLNFKFNSPQKIDLEGSLSGGMGFTDQYPTEDDYYEDVPQVSDTIYVTHRPFILPTAGKKGNKLPYESKNLKEQEDEEVEGEPTEAPPVPEETPDASSEEEPDMTSGEDTSMTDPTMAGGLTDPNLMGGYGMLGQEEPKTAGQLGRIYELKKIYSRLTSIESYLGNESSDELLEIRDYVSKAIELFEIVSSNFDSYKDRLDEIIVTYYKFILEVYDNVKDYFQKKVKSGD